VGGIGPFLSIYLSSNLNLGALQIGIALAAIGIGSLLFQIPSGLLVDAVRCKPIIITIACLLTILSCFLILNQKNFFWIIIAHGLIGIVFSLIPPSISAITLGLIGRELFPKRVSINETLIHSGTVFNVLTIGLLAHYYGHTWIIYGIMMFALFALVPLFFIDPKEVNYSAARELPLLTDSTNAKPIQFSKLLQIKNLWIFFSAVIIFHFANAAQLILIGQELTQTSSSKDSIYMGLSIIDGQIIMIFVAYFLGFFINKTGRKPIFLLAFFFLIIRATLFIFVDNPIYLIIIQLLDGISAGIFGVIAVVIISDLAVGTGRFNFLLGILGMCIGLGSALSNITAGFITKLYGFKFGFFSLALIALIGFFIYLFLLKETKKV
jgi:MFS family permease